MNQPVFKHSAKHCIRCGKNSRIKKKYRCGCSIHGKREYYACKHCGR